MAAITTQAELPQRINKIKAFAVKWRDRWQDSRVGRTIAWYNVRGGAQLAGGIAYAAMFSLIAALTIGYSVLNAFLGRNPGLSNAVLDEVQRWVPGLIGPDNDTPLSLETIPTLPRAINPTSIVASIVLLFSAIGMMTAIRKSVRAMFRTAPVQDPFFRSKIASLFGFILLGLGFLAAAITSIGTEAFGHFIYPGHPELSWLLPILAGVLGIPIDTFIVAAILRFVAGVKPDGVVQHRDFWNGAIFAGMVATLLRVAGTQIVVFAAGRNLVYLKQFAAMLTLLVIANLLARTLLYVSAWIKNPPPLDEIQDHPEIGEDFFDEPTVVGSTHRLRPRRFASRTVGDPVGQVLGEAAAD